MKMIKVVAAVIKQDNKILIAQRLKGNLAGQWEFPGGKVEAGETSEEAVKREILEEMELEIKVNNFLITAEYEYETFHLSMDCFMCSLVNKEIHLHDHSAIQWITIGENNNVNWVPADIQVYEEVVKRFAL